MLQEMDQRGRCRLLLAHALIKFRDVMKSPRIQYNETPTHYALPLDRGPAGQLHASPGHLAMF